MDFTSSLQEKFLTHLSAKALEGHPASLYEPIQYLLNLGGKRMRPVLLLMAHQIFNDEVDGALDAALAIEVFHNFTLAHDDIMDEATLRRGLPTMHEKYNVNTAILAGDLMLIKSYELLAAETGASDFLTLFRIFSKAATEICEGQQMDMDFEKRSDVDLDEYLLMIRFKTAVLLGAAMEIGALIGGATTANASLLYQFAVDLGVAFQINDDILDAYGDPAKVGKRPGGDILQNKKTFLWIQCQQSLNDHDARVFQSLIQLPSEAGLEKIEGVLKLYDTYKVKERAQEASSDFYKKALGHLDQLSVPDVKVQQLKGFASALMGREY